MSAQRPSRETVVLTIGGAVDAGTAPRLAEALGSRLRGSLELVAQDLSGLDFLAATGVQVLSHAHLQAQNAGVALLIVTGGRRPVERAFTACGADHSLSIHRGPVEVLLAR